MRATGVLSRAAVVILALAMLAPCARAATPADSAAVRAAIDDGNAAFIRAWQTGEADLFASLFAADGALLRPGGGLTVGRDKIRARMRDVFANVRMTEGTITTADVFLIGDTAYETGFWNFTIGPLGSTTSEPDSGHYVEIWKRDSKGAWRMWRDIGVPRMPSSEPPEDLGPGAPAAPASPPAGGPSHGAVRAPRRAESSRASRRSASAGSSTARGAPSRMRWCSWTGIASVPSPPIPRLPSPPARNSSTSRASPGFPGSSTCTRT